MKIIKPLLLAGLLFSSYSFALSEQVMMHYSGTVVIPPCIVSTPSLSVDFGDIMASTLANSGSATGWKMTTVRLSNCTNVTDIAILINATMSTANADYIASTGTAQHVAVNATVGPAGTTVKDGLTLAGINMAGQSDYSTDFYLQVINDGTGSATAGSVQSAITLTYAFK